MAAASEVPSLAARVNACAHLTGSFRLRSGAVSTEYFDKYRFESDPVLLAEIAAGLTGLVPPGVDALAGLELGGIPVATALSAASGLPARFVRKTAKEYGTCRLAEGGEVSGMRLVIVEDVVTAGGAILAAVAELRALGAVVEVALCVIDREAGGAASLAAEGVELRSMFTMSELREAAGPPAPAVSPDPAVPPAASAPSSPRAAGGPGGKSIT